MNENITIHSNNEIGIVNGLYATSIGSGGIVPIQIFKNYTENSEFKFRLTGKLGDTMKESIYCSYTTAIEYIKKNIKKFGIDNINDYININFKNGFHIHTEITSTPKDGPSASAFTIAFISNSKQTFTK